MHDDPSARGWLQGLFGARKSSKATGEVLLRTGIEAVLQVEEAVAEVLHHDRDEDPSALLARATGSALMGTRTAVIIERSDVDLRLQLVEAVRQCVPLVVHVVLDTHNDDESGLAALLDSGAVVFSASTVQQAADLSLVAHRVAETGLIPVVVTMDARETAESLQDVVLPIDGEYVNYLGAPDDTVACPTPAQIMLFGDRRRRLPRWFSLDSPSAHAVPAAGEDRSAQMAARHFFFDAHLGDHIDEAMREITSLTGRLLATVLSCAAKGASKAPSQVLFAHGSLADLARATLLHAEFRESKKVGLITLVALRPFPESALRKQCTVVEIAAILERSHARLAAPHWHADLRAALTGGPITWTTAHFPSGSQAITPGHVLAAVDNLNRRDRRRDEIWLGLTPPTVETRFPKREVLLNRIAREYPDLSTVLDESTATVDLRPAGAVTLAVCARETDLPAEVLPEIVRAAFSSKGPYARTRTTRPRPEYWTAHITLAGASFDDPGDAVPVDGILLAGLDFPPSLDLPAEVCEDAFLLVATDKDSEEIPHAMPLRWRRQITSKGVRVFRCASDAEAIARALKQIVDGGDFIEVEVLEFSPANDDSPAEDPSRERLLPALVRRLEGMGEGYDSVTRYWGEVAQPLLAGESATRVPDPYRAVGTAPAYTSTFHDMTSARSSVPRLLPERCTGCGVCWVVCPDAAIGVTALSTQTLIETSLDRNVRKGVDGGKEEAEKTPSVADASAKIRRAAKALAARINGEIHRKKTAVLDESTLEQSFDWLLQKLGIEDDAVEAYHAVYRDALHPLVDQPLVFSDVHFHRLQAQEENSGEALMLAINPQACQGCAGCVANCREEALEIIPQSREVHASMVARWDFLEFLPDTPGATIARAAEPAGIGKPAGVLMSRHCRQVLAGGDGAEPGSGERLAARLALAVLEHREQKSVLRRLEHLEDLGTRLREEIQAAVNPTLALDRSENLAKLEKALGESPRSNEDLDDVLGRFGEQGERVSIPAGKVKALVAAARRIEAQRERLEKGSTGLGRARFGVVVAGDLARRWAASFARNPFGVPLVVDTAARGADIARGVGAALLGEHLIEVAAMRRAEALTTGDMSASSREESVDRLLPEDLSAREREACPPIILLMGREALGERGLSSLSSLLSSDDPVKVIVLDDSGPYSASPDPAEVALSLRSAFVTRTSAAHAEHLFEAMGEALDHQGPALIHLYTPSPARNGFATEKTIEVMRKAVATRVHPLFKYAPRKDGVFGTCLDLGGNPDPGETWAHRESGEEILPTEWDPDIPDAVKEECRARWLRLQEWAGIVTPFTARIEESIRQKMQEQLEEKIAALEADRDRQIDEAVKAERARQVQHLKERLMAMISRTTPTSTDALRNEGERT